MTGSFDELRAGLADVAERLSSAGQFVRQAGVLIDDALGQLTRLSEQHSESLVPVELRRASDELRHGMQLINSGSAAVSDIEARL
ncbi:MAG TPA: hypothetical protein VNA11_16850 [Pseudonocardia sp.]|nr:hypothetical protein [Pseudonocardia sp.]